jgi:hypothetical protein
VRALAQLHTYEHIPGRRAPPEGSSAVIEADAVPRRVLALQASAGNRAVAGVLARSNGDPPPPPPPRPSAEIAAELAEVGAEINAARLAARDHLGQGELVRGQKTPPPRPGTSAPPLATAEELHAQLLGRAAGGDAVAGRLAADLGALIERRNGLVEESSRALEAEAEAEAASKTPYKTTTTAAPKPGTKPKAGTGTPKGGGTGGTTVPDVGHGAGGRPRVGSVPPRTGGGMLDDYDAGPDITAEEREAMAMPSNMIAGPGNWSLLGWLLKMLLFAGSEESLATKSAELVKGEIEARLKALGALTIAFQMRGDIAYAQVSTRTTKGDIGTVLDLTGLVVSSWFRQDRQSAENLVEGGMGLRETDETQSFALSLHPTVKAWAVGHLTNRIKTIDAQVQGTRGSAQLLTERDELVTCRNLVATKEVPAFSMLPGPCHKYLPMGTPPSG